MFMRLDTVILVLSCANAVIFLGQLLERMVKDGKTVYDIDVLTPPCILLILFICIIMIWPPYAVYVHVRKQNYQRLRVPGFRATAMSLAMILLLFLVSRVLFATLFSKSFV